MPAEEPSRSCTEVISALEPVLERNGFGRHFMPLYEVGEGDALLAGWTRAPLFDPDDRKRSVEGEGVSVWQSVDGRTPGYVNVGIGSTHLRFEWRRSRLDADELAAIIGAFISRYDDFEPPEHRSH